MSDERDRVARLSDLRAFTTAVESRFENVESLLQSLEARIEQRLMESGEATRRYFETRVEQRLIEVEQKLIENGETTRRHFDVVAESMNGTVKLVAELASVSGRPSGPT